MDLYRLRPRSGTTKAEPAAPKGRPVPSCMTRPPKRARESRAGRCRVSPSPRRQAGVVPQSIPAAPHPGEATTWAAFAERFCRTERDRPPSPPMFNQSHTSASRVSSVSWLGRQAVLPRLGGLCLMGWASYAVKVCVPHHVVHPPVRSPVPSDLLVCQIVATHKEPPEPPDGRSMPSGDEVCVTWAEDQGPSLAQEH
jgi:hypothetical protein